jgi:glycosyltransferase involved in cell wall biosynthesis
MKIAYVSTLKSSSWGGSEELWYKSAKEALKKNHIVGVFVYKWKNDAQQITELINSGAIIFRRKKFQKFLTRMIIKLFNSFLHKMPLFYNPYKSIFSFKPDLIVITDGSTYYTANDPSLVQILKEYRGKYIIICQGNTAYHFPEDREAAIQLFENSKEIIFVSENNRKLALHQLGFNLSKTSLIQNPCNLSTYEIRPLPSNKGGIINCAIIGRLCTSDKGQDIVIAMMAEEFWRKSNLHIYIYGKGNDRSHLQALIKFYDVAEKVSLEGFSEIEEVWERNHCLLLPSIQEGTPLTLLEALVIGRICVVTDVGGNSEWIEDNINGFIAEAPTQKLISRKMKMAVGEYARWDEIASEAHTSAIKKLDFNPGLTLLNKIEN